MYFGVTKCVPMTAVLILKSNLSFTCYSNVTHDLHFHLLKLVAPLLPLAQAGAFSTLQWNPGLFSR